MDTAPDTTSHARPKAALFATVAFIAAAADIGTKEWAFSTGKLHVRETVIEDVFYITPVYNDGVVWGAFQDSNKNVLFIVISAAAVPIIVRMFATFRERLTLTALALGGVLGGTLGNLYDRIVHHAVRDHLEFHIRIPVIDWNYHWPIFNVADAFICAGAILFALCVMFGKKGKETAPDLTGAPAAPQA